MVSDSKNLVPDYEGMETNYLLDLYRRGGLKQSIDEKVANELSSRGVDLSSVEREPEVDPFDTGQANVPEDVARYESLGGSLLIFAYLLPVMLFAYLNDLVKFFPYFERITDWDFLSGFRIVFYVDAVLLVLIGLAIVQFFRLKKSAPGSITALFWLKTIQVFYMARWSTNLGDTGFTGHLWTVFIISAVVALASTVFFRASIRVKGTFVR